MLEVFVNSYRTWLLLLIVIIAGLLSGCDTDNPVAPAATATPTLTPVPPVADSGGGESDQPEAVPATAETAPEATPFDLTQLHATDPSSVNLASGRPTVLEFFAFW
jgi:hypothetical protein